MAENFILGWSSVTDSLTFTESNEETNAPSTNLGTMQPTEVWQSANYTSTYVQVDAGANATVKLAAMLYSNADASTNIQYRADTDSDPTVTPVYDTGAVSHQMTGTTSAWGRQSWYDWDSTGHSTRYHRFDISGGSLSFYRAGRMVLCTDANLWQPSVYTMEYEWEMGWIEDSEIYQAHGPTYVRQVPRRRYVEFIVRTTTESEMYEEAFNIDQRRGVSEDVIFIVDPADTTYPHHRLIYGRIADMGPIIHTTNGLWEKSYRIEELL